MANAQTGTDASPAASHSNIPNEPYTDPSANPYKGNLPIRSLATDFQEREEEDQKALELASRWKLNRHRGSASRPTVPKDNNIEAMGKSYGLTASYLNYLDTPAKNSASSSAPGPEEREVKDLGKSHNIPSYLDPHKTPTEYSIRDARQGSEYRQGKRRASHCVVVAGGILCKKTVSDNREDTADQTRSSRRQELKMPLEDVTAASELRKRNEGGKCKWYHLGSVTVCAWMVGSAM